MVWLSGSGGLARHLLIVAPLLAKCNHFYSSGFPATHAAGLRLCYFGVVLKPPSATLVAEVADGGLSPMLRFGDASRRPPQPKEKKKQPRRGIPS